MRNKKTAGILMVTGLYLSRMEERIAYALMGVHPDAKICRAEKENTNPKLL